MQKLDLDFLNSLPDNESLALHLKSLPQNTLHLFLNDRSEILLETQTLEENYHKILSFFLGFLEKTDKILLEKSQEIETLNKDLYSINYSLENNQKITHDFSEWNRKLQERTQILISKNQELEQSNTELMTTSKTIENPEKPMPFLSNIEEDEEFLKDFFQKEDNMNFLKKLGFHCECSIKIHRLEEEIVKLRQMNDMISSENEALKAKNLHFEKKLNFLYNDFRRSQIELTRLKEKGKIYETFKFEFLLNSKKPLIDLEIQSASRVDNDKSEKKRRLKLKKNSLIPEHLSNKSSQNSMTLLTDIEKTLGNKEDDHFEEEEIFENKEEIQCRIENRKKRMAMLECLGVEEVKKKHDIGVFNSKLNAKFMDLWMFFIIFLMNLTVKVKRFNVREMNIRKLVVFWPKLMVLAMLLYWMNVMRIIMMFYEGAHEISLKILKLPFFVLRKLMNV